MCIFFLNSGARDIMLNLNSNFAPSDYKMTSGNYCRLSSGNGTPECFTDTRNLEKNMS